MTRRRIVALVSAAVLVLLGIVAVASVFFVTRTDYGRERVRSTVAGMLKRSVHGSVYLGKISGSFLNDLTIDSLAIRDSSGELFVSTGRVRVGWNPRDFFDRRIYIRTADIQHPYVHLRQHSDGRWNFNEVLGGGGVPKPREPNTRSFGDYIVVDSAHVSGGTFLLSLPWSPDDTLKGARRDSVIRYNLTRADHVIRRTPDGFAKTYTWRNATGLLTHARLADPDSDRFGREITVATLNVDELDPPFEFHSLTGMARNLGDSVWFQAPHFDLPGSTGSATGKIVWGSDLPIRYDIAVRGDSVSLNDVNWVYPTLPRTGGGSTLLTIRNDPKNLHVVNFTLSQMDMRSTKSHLTGTMSFGVGAPILLVRDLDVKADPLNWDLIRTLNGKPFPEDWQGDIVGSVRARGGPLTHFYVDEGRGTWYDTHVRGAVSRVAGRGELDILDPALTAFHGFNVNVASLDLRSIEYLFPAFPRLGGTVAGTATLDSSWLDVRFSNAHLTHQDGPGDPSAISGSGRITYGDPFMVYDVALDAAPLSLTMLGRSYPGLPFHGLVSGPIRVKGTAPDLAVTTALQGPTGALSFDGTVDIDSLGGYGAHGKGDFSNVNVAALLDNPNVPTGTLSGRYVADVAGETAASTKGAVDLTLDRSIFDGIQLYPSQASVRFEQGRMFVDSMRLHTAAATIFADRGAIGLPGGVSDSIRLTVSVDSLGGLRRYLGRADSAVLGAADVADSLAGTVMLQGIVRGRLDSLDARGMLSAKDVYVRKNKWHSVTGDFDLRNLPKAPSGTLAMRADSVTLAGVLLDTLGLTLRAADLKNAAFMIGAHEVNGVGARATGSVVTDGGLELVHLDSLAVDAGRDVWRLASAANLRMDSTRIRLDSLLLRNRDSASILLTADVPATGGASAALLARGVPLADVGIIGQFRVPLAGIGDVDAVLSGTRTAPRIVVNATARDVTGGTANVERISSTGEYRDRRFNATLDLFHKGQRAVQATASLPMDLTLFRLRFPDDSLHVAVRADSADLGIVEALTGGALDSTSGKLTANIDVLGTWKKVVYGGSLRVTNGSLGIPALGRQKFALAASAHLIPGADTLVIDSLRARVEDGAPGNSLRVAGTIANASDAQKRRFNIRADARQFNAIDLRSLATVDVSTGASGMTLTGPASGPALSGTLNVDRGSIYIPDPELSRKEVSEFEVDTTTGVAAQPAFGADFLNALNFRNVTVRLGDDVWLTSPLAHIKLAGSLAVPTVPSTTPGFGACEYSPIVCRMRPDGTLQANTGTYTLDLGLARREFQVQKGTVQFLGSINPEIDVTAQYTVRQAKAKDIGVIVNVRGPLQPGPKIELSSTENYAISQSDLVSLLVTGQPGFDLGADQARVVASFLAPTASSILTSNLRTYLGSWVDLVRFQGASPDATSAKSGATEFGRSFLTGATVGGEKQISNNVFLSLNAGLCRLFNQQQIGGAADQGSLLDAFGGKIEYRFDPNFSLQAGREQPYSARYCTSQSFGSVATPSQLSFSLSRTWRF